MNVTKHFKERLSTRFPEFELGTVTDAIKSAIAADLEKHPPDGNFAEYDIAIKADPYTRYASVRMNPVDKVLITIVFGNGLKGKRKIKRKKSKEIKSIPRRNRVK